MKKILLALAAVATIFAGCDKGLEDRVSSLENKVSELESFVANLNAQVQGIQTIVDNLEKNVYVTKVEELKDDSDVVTGYRLIFNQGNPVEIFHGSKGDIGNEGTAGKTPTIDCDEDGNWYWAYLGGGWILDGEDNKIPVYKSLDFEISEGVLYVKIDGAPAVEVGHVQGEKGDSWFEGLFVNEADGTVTIDVVGTDRKLVLPLAEYFNIVFNLSEVKGYMENKSVKIPYDFVGGAKVSEVTVRVLKSENCQVEIDKYNQVVTITPGVGEGYVDLYAIYNPTGELRAKTISFNADNYFEITNSAYAVSPVGGNVEVPVTTSAEYNLEIDGDWLTYTETTETKAIRKETIVLTAGANATGADRTATVTLRLKGDTKVLGTFEVTQKVLDTKLVGKEYVESYTKSYQAYSGTLKFELSDDFSKGVYKVTICGVTVYADVEGNTLKLYDGSRTRPLTFSADYSTVTATSFEISSKGVYSVSNYKAFLPLGPAELTEAEAALVGTYDESWKFGNNAVAALGGMVISASEEASYGQLKVRFFTYQGGSFEVYGVLNEGKLTVKVGGLTHPTLGQVYNPDEKIEFTVNNDGTLTFASFYLSKNHTNYVATKVVEQEGGDKEEGGPLAGTWNVTCEMGDTWGSDVASKTGTMVITGSGENYVIQSIAGVNYGLSVVWNGSALTGGKNGATMTLVYDEANGTLTFTGEYMDYEHNVVKNIVATR